MNLAFLISLVLAAVGAAGILLTGKGRTLGPMLGLAVQPVWALFAVVTKGYGLLLTCLLYGAVHAANLRRMYREREQP